MLLEAYVMLPDGAGATDVENLFGREEFYKVPQIELARSKAALTPTIGVAAAARRGFPGFINMMINTLPTGEHGESTDVDIKQMEDSMRMLGKYSDGFVIGMTTPDGRLDMNSVARLKSVAKGKPLTYRFDDIKPEYRIEAMAQLAALGVKSILTSGAYGHGGTFDRNADDLLEIASLARHYGIKTVARGGITVDHFKNPVQQSMLAEIGGAHAWFHDTAKEGDKKFSWIAFATVLDYLQEGVRTVEAPRLKGTPLFSDVKHHPDRPIRRRMRTVPADRRFV